MSWIGKLLGFLVGALILGPIGALLGLFLGHFLDKAGQARQPVDPVAQATAQQTLFSTTFLVMGHIAKADGRVSEDEIRAARAIMRHMGLGDTERAQAIRLFTQGKAATFQLDPVLQTMAKHCKQYRPLLRTFLEIQLQAAYADGLPSAQQQQILQHCCRLLGIAPLNFRFLNMIYGRFQQGAYTHTQHERYARPTLSLSDCYAMLEIEERATDAEVKRAYRKRMSEHHPDKLAAKGLPDSMLKIATEKTQNIQKAYEAIKKARGFS